MDTQKKIGEDMTAEQAAELENNVMADTNIGDMMKKVLGDIREKQGKASEIAHAIALFRSQAITLGEIYRVARLGDKDAKKFLDELETLRMEADNNVFAKRFLSICDLTNELAKAGEKKVVLTYVEAIKKAVAIGVLAECEQDAKGEDIISFFDYRNKQLKRFNLNYVMEEDKGLFYDLREEHRNSEHKRLVNSLKDGAVASKVGVCLGLEMRYLHLLGQEEAGHLKDAGRLHTYHYADGMVVTPLSMHKRGQKEGNASMELFTAIKDAYAREAGTAHEQLGKFIFPMPRQEEGCNTGSLTELFAGAPGTVVITNWTKEYGYGNGKPAPMSIEVVRDDWDAELMVMRVSNREFAKDIFSPIVGGKKEFSHLPIKYEIVEQNGKKLVKMAGLNHELFSFLLARLKTETQRGADLCATVSAVSQQRLAHLRTTRSSYKEQATVSKREFMDGTPGIAAFCHNEWRIGDEKRKFVDALLKSDGKNISILQASPFVKRTVFSGYETGLVLRSLPPHIFAWMSGCEATFARRR